MARQTGQRRAASPIRGRLELSGAEPETLEQLVIEVVDAKGERFEVTRADDGSIELDSGMVGKGHTLELRAKEGGEPRRFALDTFADRLATEKTYVLPERAWRPIFPVFECVTGHVSVCRPFWLIPFETAAVQLARQLRMRPFGDVIAELGGSGGTEVARPYSSALVGVLPYPWSMRCLPVCHGKVEVFVRTCCCEVRLPRPPIIIRDLCRIIDCEPPVGPWPPEPDPPYRLTVDPAFGERLATRIEGASGRPGDPDAEDLLRLADHLTTLRSLPITEQREYIASTPELAYWNCSCSTRQVATTYLNPDGTYDACFFSGYTPAGCTQRVIYRVSQLTTTGWQVVYDGLARNQSFGIGEDASISTSWLARGCADEPVPVPGDPPFVLLEKIGRTWASDIIASTLQNGPSSYAGPLAANDGLAVPRPGTALPITSGPNEMAWCSGLGLRFRFQDALAGGPYNATKYRLRYVEVDGQGLPVPNSARPLASVIAWPKFAPAPGGGVQVVLVSLNTPDEGVYRIPYFDPQWQWLDEDQFHGIFDTTQVPNGRYMILLDLLRDDLTRLTPNNSSDQGIAGDVSSGFRFRRLTAPIVAGSIMATADVPHSTLGHIVQVNNRPAVGDITHIEFAGSASSVNCQFLTGRDCDTVALRYTASQADGFQWYHEIWYKQGLSGPIIPTVPPEAAEVSAAEVINGPSVVRRLDSMLRGELRCSFAANLRVYTRHTAGYGWFQGYGASDQAAFALETTGNKGCP